MTEKKALAIDVAVGHDPEFGYSVVFNFSHKIRSFGLSDEKAEIFAQAILQRVKEIRAVATE